MDNKKDQHTLPVFSQKLAATLMLLGFNLLSMSPNRTRADKNVYYFRSSNEIREKIAEYVDSRKIDHN